jgi:hypothetical protein
LLTVVLSSCVSSRQLFEFSPPIRPRIYALCTPDDFSGCVLCIPDAFWGQPPPAPALPGSEPREGRVACPPKRPPKPWRRRKPRRRREGPSDLPKLAPFLCSPRKSYTAKDFKSFRFSTYKHFLMMLKTKDFKPFRISRSTIFARNPFGFSTYIKTWGGGGGMASISNSAAMRAVVVRAHGSRLPPPERLSGGAECANLGIGLGWMARRCTLFSAAPRDAGAYPESPLIPSPDASRLRRKCLKAAGCFRSSARANFGDCE